MRFGFGRSARPLVSVLGLVLMLVGGAACASDTGDRHPELVVGSAPDPGSVLLADIYVAALRSYGFAAHSETAANAMLKLDAGGFTVIPAFTGATLQALQPSSTAMKGTQVYRAMAAALPEGVVAGDYSISAEDKPALAIASATAQAWGGSALAELLDHCDGLVVGVVRGAAAPRPPASVGSCRLPTPREFPDSATMFAALQAGEVNQAWTSTADPAVPANVALLGDGDPPLIRAENLVPLYRRNALTDRQLLAINQVAGVLDTVSLVDMRRRVAGGADPQAVADAWLRDHPLGR